jgi:hypothetical protein
VVALAAVVDELAGALGELEQVLAAGDGPVRLDDAGELVISPLTAEDIPGEAVAPKAELTDTLPFAPIVSLLIELDGRTGLLDYFTHAGGKQTRSDACRAPPHQGVRSSSAAWASVIDRLRTISQPRGRSPQPTTAS